MKTSLKSLGAILSFLMMLSACAPAPRLGTSQDSIEIDQAVVRLPGAPMAGMNSDTSLAGYMLIKNTGVTDDSLVGIQADFAAMSMLHESSVDQNGVAVMKHIMTVAVPAGQTVEFKPGGLHVMFNALKQNVKVGDTVTLTLQFTNAGMIRVQAKVINP